MTPVAGATSFRCRRWTPPFRGVVLAGLLFALLIPPPTYAGSWELESGVRLSHTHTDNIGLTASDPESEHITELAPRIRADRLGARSEFGLDYRVRGVRFHNDSSRDRVLHEGRGDASVELARNRLFLDGDVARRADLVAGDRTVPDADIFGERGGTSVTRYGGGPRVSQTFGRYAGLGAGYRRERVDFSDSGIPSTDTDIGWVELVNGPRFTRLGWELGYRRREESGGQDFEGRGDRTFSTAQAEVSVQAAARTRLFVGGGYDDFRYEEEGGELDGGFWEGGVRWTPHRRVALEAAAGERYGGRTGRVAGRVEGARLTANATYVESVQTRTTALGEFLDRSEAEERLQAGEDAIFPTASPDVFLAISPTDEVILQQRATGSVTWDQGHSRVGVSLTGTEREFQLTGDTERTRSSVLSHEWSRLPKTTIATRVGFTQREFRDEREDDLISLGVLARRDMGRAATVSLSYRVDDLDSSGDDAGYRVRRATLTLDKVF